MSDDFTNIEWTNVRERFAPPKRLEPQIDIPITKAVGFKVFLGDPRVIKVIIKYKG